LGVNVGLTEKDRDELLIDVLEAITHLTAQLEFKHGFSSRVLYDKVRHYKDLLYKENIDSGIESIEIPSPPRVPAFARETQPDIVVPSIKTIGYK